MVKKKDADKKPSSPQGGVGKRKAKPKKTQKAPRVPKAPLTASQLYTTERSVALASTNSNLNATQATAVAKAEWDRMDKEDQSPWLDQERVLQEKYQKALERYQVRLKKWEARSEEDEEDNEDNEEGDGDGEEHVERRGRKRKEGKKRKREKDPNRPKKGLNPYFMYARERVKVLRAGDPNIQQKNALAVATQEWKAMTDAQKKPYQDRAAQDKARYEAELRAYNERRGEPKEEARAPKKGLNPFMFYSRTRIKEIRAADPHIEQKVALKQASEEWKAMSEAQKRPYLDMAAKDKLRHKEELVEFLTKRN